MNGSPTQDNLHGKIVNEVLPHVANMLQREGEILSYGNELLKVPLSADLPQFVVKPDLVLCLRSGKKLLVEVANPKDPKRFVGELVYLQLLGYYKLVVAAMVFVLPYEKQYEGIHTTRIFQTAPIKKIISRQIPCPVISWPHREEAVYSDLKYLCKNYRSYNLNQKLSC